MQYTQMYTGGSIGAVFNQRTNSINEPGFSAFSMPMLMSKNRRLQKREITYVKREDYI